jgi:hypothetical protein
MSDELDAKELRVGMRVITVAGDQTGTVKANDVENNTCAVLLDGEKTVTPQCHPNGFRILQNPELRLTGVAPQDTIARSSL